MAASFPRSSPAGFPEAELLAGGVRLHGRWSFALARQLPTPAVRRILSSVWLSLLDARIHCSPA